MFFRNFYLMPGVALIAVAASCFFGVVSAAEKNGGGSSRFHLDFPGGEKASVIAGDDWSYSDDDECLLFIDGRTLCPRSARAGGLGACEWLEAAARFMDAPNDRNIEISTVRLETGDSGAESACAGRIFSPRQNLIFHRACFIKDDTAYSLAAAPAPAIAEYQGNQFFDALRHLASSFSFGDSGQPSRGPAAEKQPERPDFSDIKREYANYSPQPRPGELLQADRLRLAHRFDEARALYSSLEDTYPYGAAVGLGDTALSRRNDELAADHYRRALELDPSRPDAYNGLGSVALMRGNLDEAEERFSEARQRGGPQPDTFANLGWLELSRGRYPEAEEHFMRTLAMKPNPDAAGAATNGLTIIDFYHGEPANAAAWNISLLSWLPDYPEAHANLVRAYLAMDRTADAFSAAKKLEDLAPDTPGARLLASRAYFRAGRYAECAARICPMAFDRDPALGALDYTYCARSLRKTGEESRAREVLEIAAASDAAGPEHFLLLSELSASSGDDREALDILLDAREMFPDNPDIQERIRLLSVDR